MFTVTPITVRPIQRPRYQNAHVASFPAWFRDNEPAVVEYYYALVAVESERPDAHDFFEFALCQYDRACMEAS
jgi:hypothetical protein